LIAFLTIITIYRYIGRLDIAVELGIILSISYVTLQHFFEAFWRTYEEATENERSDCRKCNKTGFKY